MGFEVLGAGVWALVYLGLGVLLARQIEAVIAWLREAGTVAGAVLLAVLALYLLWRWLRRLRALRDGGLPRVSVQELLALLDSAQPPAGGGCAIGRQRAAGPAPGARRYQRGAGRDGRLGAGAAGG